MKIPTVTPRAFARLAFLALALNVAIVLTGAAVRVTGSGLGCPTWPTCEDGRLIGAWEYHAAIEWGNRLFTTAITIGVVVTLLGAIRRRPRQRDLVVLSAVLVGGVVAQALLGGLTVLFHLEPPFVMAHFLVSMVLVAAGTALWFRARAVESVSVGARAARLVRATLIGLAVVLVLGTFTTASGPHSGGEEITRLGNLELAARLHGTAVAIVLGLALVTRVALGRSATAPAMRVATVLVWMMAAQGVLGFVQYRLELPRGLVELHVAGAVVIWAVVVWLALLARRSSPGSVAFPVPGHRKMRTERVGG